MKAAGKRPNFLIITTDEERFPPPYENEEARRFRVENDRVGQELREHGIEFLRHHTASTACAPSRTTLYTGQYPSLHGVSQTPGIGKSSFDPDMYWLAPNTVPTLGEYFRKGGYQTHYRGKWHLSDEDILVPGTQTPLMSNDATGDVYPERVALYEQSGRLEKFGFSGWIGPEPHGSSQANDGTVRDPGFADQVCRLLSDLDRQATAGETAPWLLVSSFVNPHDIVFSGLPWFTVFNNLQAAGKLPDVEPAPTAGESLESKPRCQKDYVYTYPRMYLPQRDTASYRQLYYFLMAEVSKHIHRVYEHLKRTSFFENTIVVLTSDHGEMLGAHGGMMQKWYNAYQETLHVPFVISNPGLFPEPRRTELVTSHVDLVPTLLGLAGIDVEAARRELARDHSEAQPLVGRDLSGLVLGREPERHEPIYFMTDDNVESGLQMTNNLTGQEYAGVIQPKHIETVVTRLPELTGDTLWKFSCYSDNPRFFAGAPGNTDEVATARFIPREYECYDLTEDPLETRNRCSAVAAQPLPQDVRDALEKVLKEQREKKRLLPQSLNRNATTKGPLRD
ncbi:sulfatase-like hydrolase/transferase [Corallococcus macrosporus]|uniref:Sulfatase family protein n=1 Tax=Myxococcus fulvus (strain ATCC BAA-855 / HW-1) TaxID=483219 RepID=F8CQU4_MYXFH|nr:sulfatase-like hydrolase/transferase [Corallococcus macrosporus]AEI68008.1 sulfatase family protein [Corallococcus macrosporus]